MFILQRLVTYFGLTDCLRQLGWQLPVDESDGEDQRELNVSKSLPTHVASIRM
jgi:hypothetical protein